MVKIGVLWEKAKYISIIQSGISRATAAAAPIFPLSSYYSKTSVIILIYILTTTKKKTKIVRHCCRHAIFLSCRNAVSQACHRQLPVFAVRKIGVGFDQISNKNPIIFGVLWDNCLQFPCLNSFNDFPIDTAQRPAPKLLHCYCNHHQSNPYNGF